VPARTLALVGESGAGKSTLLRLLREQQPQQVAWCPQAQGLVPVLSVFPQHLHGPAGPARHVFYNLAQPALSRANAT
jgi:phosphonate transport system ATP-binding protein